jgi:hypothetical protein
MNTPVTEAVTLFDKNSPARKSLFALMAINGVDGIRFYEFAAASLTKLRIASY